MGGVEVGDLLGSKLEFGFSLLEKRILFRKWLNSDSIIVLGHSNSGLGGAKFKWGVENRLHNGFSLGSNWSLYT